MKNSTLVVAVPALLYTLQHDWFKHSLNSLAHYFTLHNNIKLNAAIVHNLGFISLCVQLFVVREFKDMLVAAERHYSDMKFAHLTGKAKDRVWVYCTLCCQADIHVVLFFCYCNMHQTLQINLCTFDTCTHTHTHKTPTITHTHTYMLRYVHMHTYIKTHLHKHTNACTYTTMHKSIENKLIAIPK